MGQQKGNPTPSYQNQAYETLRPNTNARENRNYGTKPVMIDDNTTLSAVIDATFATDANISSLSGSVSATYITSASMVNTLTSVIVYGGFGGGHANDAAAALAGCPVGGLYHFNGAIKVRLT